MKFECYHSSVQCYSDSLTKNRITTFRRLFQIEEDIRFLNLLEVEQKKSILKEQVEVMTPQIVGKTIYESSILVRSFEYIVRSRSLYNRLRYDYRLPSIKTLTTLTSKTEKLNDLSFLSEVFTNVEGKQRKCVVLVDEVYVKASLMYHGGYLYGFADNKEKQVAKTFLSVMIKCLVGGPKFLVKMIPVVDLDSEFLFEHVTTIINLIKEVHGEAIAVICDNRINETFEKKIRQFLVNHG